MSVSLGEIAELTGGRLRGDAERLIRRVSTLTEATDDALSFVTGPRYREAAQASRAGALLVPVGVAFPGRDLVEVEDPHAALALLLGRFHPAPEVIAGVHPSAVVAPTATIDPSTAVGPYAVVGERVTLGAGVSIGAHSVVETGSSIGAGSRLYPHVVVYADCRIGARCILHSGVVVGSDGFGYASGAAGHTKIPQVGGVEIGDDVEIGANTTIDRASLGRTRIGGGTKIDNLVQVGHSVVVGEHSLLVSQSGIAGSSTLGRQVVLAGQSGVAGHLEIGDGVRVAAKSAVLQSVEARRDVGGIPAVDLADWRRQQALVRRLADLRSRLRRLERLSEQRGGENSE